MVSGSTPAAVASLRWEMPRSCRSRRRAVASFR
jgi:hypothetical protein